MADDRLVFCPRDLSIDEIIDDTDVFFIFAIRCNSDINSGSSDMLV